MELVMHTRVGQGGMMVVVEGKKSDVDVAHVQDDMCVATACPESSTWDKQDPNHTQNPAPFLITTITSCHP